jgi:serine/threonine protein kinase
MPVESRNALLAGRYRVVRPLGSGGMAAVFLCEDERLGRRVAVKKLHAQSPDDVARRFAREAKLGASLNHPNLVSVYDTVTDDEGVLIVMEHVEGETLRDVLERGPLPPERALPVLGKVGRALDHAHSHGVIHRDVKPANILLRKDGEVKLVDLGIATATDVTRITQSGTVLGTASYMAPEQLEGAETGAAADVYALATVAFEVLGGRKARRGSTPMEIAHRVVSEPPPDVRDAWPNAPAGLAGVFNRGMARDPSARPSSAGELCTEIERAMTETRRQTPAPRRPPPAAPRMGMRTILPVAGLLSLAAVAVVIAVLSAGGDGSSERAAKAPPAGGSSTKHHKPSQQPQVTAAPQPAGDGASLNRQGFDLMNAGRYEEAVPVLRRAVAAFPSDTTDVNFAYALYNLGKSLRLAGRADEAVPVLERRLRIPNQPDTVRRELEKARREAGRG